MKAAIICNGNILDYSRCSKLLKDCELIICADGGARHLEQLKINTHVLLGDFDSIPPELYQSMAASQTEVLSFPCEKDMTDTELALEVALERGADRIYIVGGLGSRLDHSLANVFLLKRMLSRGVKGVVTDGLNEAAAIMDGMDIEKEDGYKITLLPLTEQVEGVTTEGLYYPLVDATLQMGSTWGVSNECCMPKARVTLKKGILLVIKSRD